MKLLIALLALPSIALADGYYPVPANPPGFVYALPPVYTPPPLYVPPPVFVQPARPFVPYQMPSTGIAVPYGGSK
jgi:hypothetical protein